jgi:RNA recognition motif-containing protein
MKNIYVGNLDFRTTEEQLRTLFEAYGQIDKASIARDQHSGQSRGFGFVEMTNNEEGEKAIAALNGKEVDGRTINVNEARPKGERKSFGGDRGGGRGGYRGGGGGRRY